MLFSNVNEEEFELVSEFEKAGVIYKEVRLKNRGHRCQGCGTFHTNVKEYRTKKIRHSVYAHQNCFILYKQRRFICPKCRMTAMETNPFISHDDRVSDQTIINALTDLKRYNNTFTAVAERYGLSVRGVMSLFDRYCQMERNRLPKVLCIDEIYFSRKRRKKYVLVLLNFFNRAIIDVLKDRDKHTIASYLSKIPREERDAVEYISIDMNDNYRDVLQVYLKNAAIVADSFHVIKRVNKVLDDKRRKIMRRFEDNKSSDEYYLLKYRDQLLFSKSLSYDRTMNRHFRYYISENELLGMILKIDPELESSYHLVQKYILFNDHDYGGDLKTARNDLEELIIEFKLSGISGFPELAATLEYWKEEIISSFSLVKGQRVSNGPIEGRNSLIKKVLHLANGYTNFDRFRNRIIYSLNKYASHSFQRE
ncbi:MAG: ISL3 family transposase [Eubacterium sp.]|nr:ISL3 family transposase [Clostridiales bacterium]MBQ3296050.1 ISL3 family transposase [Erysipelotrichaceae bacterium]MBR0397250.1 ISL3 family transposase [Eubacterium sp.]